MSHVPDGFETVSCPGCGAGDGHAAADGNASDDGADRNLNNPVVYEGRDWICNIDEPMRVQQCPRCGLCYTNPRPTSAALGRYYPQEYEPYQRQKGEVDRGGGWQAGVRSLVLRDAYAAPFLKPRGAAKAVAKIVQLFRSPQSFGFAMPYQGSGKLLDFGCGNGTFLRRMKTLGWDVTGVDFSEQAVAAVRASGIRALQGTLPHPGLSPSSFDLITLRHALEHVPDARAILQAIHHLLVPGGRVHIQVPNFASWEVEHFRDASHVLQLPRHFLHFSPASLENLLIANGFAEVSVRQECRPGWLKKSAQMTDRYTPSETDKQMAKSTAACRRVAKQAQREGKGNELIASARRPR